MKLLAAVALVIPAALTVLPGCPLQCGDWQGAGDTMYRNDRGESLMLCQNGGYAATLNTGMVEGVFEYTDMIRGANPETGARTFTMATSPDGTATSAELAGTWTVATLDQVELDHAHIQCLDLETRAWWGTVGTTAFLPKAAAFKKPATGFETAEACWQAQAAGEYPEAARCEDELLACPDGRVLVTQGQSFSTGDYTAAFGALVVSPRTGGFASFEGVYSAAGTLTTRDVYGSGTTTTTWRQVPVSELSNGTGCQ